MTSNSRLVYSTEHAVPRKDKKQADRAAAAAPGKGKMTVRLDRKARRGKTVTLIEGLHLAEQERENLLKQLKAKLGAGGAVKNGILEIQGDHCDVVMVQLSGLGYNPKRFGR